MRTLFALLLILQCVAAYRLAEQMDARLLLGYWALISLLTYTLYWHDKRQAKRSGWRVPEAQLHLCALLGGWSAAFLAQQQFCHKTRKRSFQIIYLAIVSIHQYLAVEWVFG